MDFNRYFTNNELNAQLEAWSEAHPHIFNLEKLGESFEKRPIWLAVITNKASGADTSKPAVWVDANIHATEIAGTTTALHLLDTLLNGYANDPQITRLIDQSVFYIVPRLNPDGAELAMAANPSFIRSGVRSYPWKEKDDGLHEQDIDGDGRILQMRIKDPNGDWKISSLDSRLLEKRAPAEQGGTYYRLLPEGLIENYDGYLIKLAKPVQGLDFNRNFPFEWRPEADQSGAGPFPASESEIRAVLNFFADHPNISFAVSFHTFSRVILRPYGTRPDDDFETRDLWAFKAICDLGTRLTGYRSASTFHDFKYHPKEVITGVFDDWVFDHLGIFGFTIELWDLPTAAGIKDRKFIDWFRAHPHEEDLQILNWALENAGEGAFVDWRPFDHPQLGQVELGGWYEMYTWRNPPPGQMGAEAANQTPYVLAMGEMLPRLNVHTLSVTPMGNSDYQVNLVVENSGFLPTFTTEQGRKRKAARPVRVELDLPQGAWLVSGKARHELGHLEGRSNKLDVSSLWAESPTDNRARAEWVLHADRGAQVTIKILSDRAGSIVQTITLQ